MKTILYITFLVWSTTCYSQTIPKQKNSFQASLFMDSHFEEETPRLVYSNDYFINLDNKYKLGYSDFLVDTPSVNKPILYKKKLQFQASLHYLDQANKTLKKIENIKISNNNIPSENFDRFLKSKIDTIESLTLKYNNQLNESILAFVDTKNNNKFYALLFENKFKGNHTELTKAYFEKSNLQKNINTLRSYNFTSDFKSSLNAYSELVTAYLWKGRFSGAALVHTEDIPEGQSDTIVSRESMLELLTVGGGNFSFNYTVPLLHLNLGRFFKSGMVVSPNLGFSIPQLNYTINEFNLNYGTDLHAFIFLGTSTDDLQFFGSAKASFLKTNDNLANTLDVENKVALYQFQFGISINETFRIGVNIFEGNESIKDALPPTLINFQLIPN